MLEHLLGSCASIMMPGQHGHEEVSKSKSLFFFDQILLSENFVDWPKVETGNVAKIAFAIKEFAGMFA